MKKVYNTEIISVGTEILLGQVVNTDARDISVMLSKIGINVRYHTVVGDNPQRLEDCVRLAKERADIIITTGGLGPTYDDLTKQILVKAFDMELVRDEYEYNLLYSYGKNHPEFPENNYQQAMLPEGCTVFHNNWGTAPGCAFEKDGKHVLMFPGPPKECNAMFENCAIPYLRQLSDEQIVTHSVRIFGLSESQVDNLFAEEMKTMSNPTMAPYTKESDCMLQVTAKAHSEEEAEEMLRPLIAHIKEKVGESVYGVDIESLEEGLIQMLHEKGKTFALAESCTGGELAKRYTDNPGASECFLGGVVTYTNAAKEKLLGIDHALIEEKGAVSSEVAIAMAERVREILGADIGIGVTGLAGPGDDGVNRVGTVYVAMATAEGSHVRKAGRPSTRSFTRRMAGNIAFDMIRRYLTGMDI